MKTRLGLLLTLLLPLVAFGASVAHKDFDIGNFEARPGVVKLKQDITVGSLTATNQNPDGISIESPGLIQTRTLEVNSGFSASRLMLDPRTYGALIDGTTDDSAAVNAALSDLSADGGGELVFPVGTCKLNSDIVVPNNSGISGASGSVLDFSGATLTTAGILVAGSMAALPSVSGTVTNKSLIATFVSAPSVVAGDTIVFHNPADYSFNPFRAEYRAGEYCRVASISGSTVTFTAPTYGTYTNGAVNVYKLSPASTHIRNLKIIGKNGNLKPTIKLSMAQNCTLSDLVLTGSEYVQILVDRCYACSIANIYAHDTSANVGYNYGILVGNSQRMTLVNIISETTRHALSFGGGNYAGAVPNRECSVIGGVLSSSGQVYGLNFHGNSEFCTVLGVTLPNGVEVADNITVQSCQIGNANLNGYAFTDDAESNGSNTLFQGNHVVANRYFNEGLITFTSYTNTSAGSSCRFLNNWVDAGPFTRTDYPAGKTTVMRFLVFAGGQPDVKFEASGNEIRTTCAFQGEYNGIDAVVAKATNSLSSFTACHNTLQNCGIKWDTSVQNVALNDNHVFDSLGDGINGGNVVGGTLTKAVIEMRGNTVLRSTHTGIKVIPDTLSYITVKNNTVLQNALVTQGNTLDTQCYIGQGAVGLVDGNTFGDTSGTTTNYVYCLGTTVSVHRNNQKIGLSNVFVGSVAANNVGTPVNTVIYTDATYGYRGDTKMFWDSTLKTLCLGAQSAGIAKYSLRAVDNFASDTHWMQVANGGSAGAAGWTMASENTSGYIRNYPTTWGGLAAQVGRTEMAANSGSGLNLSATTAGMTIDFYTDFGKVLSLSNSLVNVIGTMSFNGAVASTLVQLDGVKNAVSIANGAGYLRNDGSGAFTYDSTHLQLTGITKAQKTALTPANGWIVYQTDNTPGLRAYVNGAWVMVSTVADP